MIADRFQQRDETVIITAANDDAEHGSGPVADLNKLDLNLLRVFDAVARERHVTNAAQKLNLSQPAVSNALARLRGALKDELFMRRPGGVEPTALIWLVWTVAGVAWVWRTQPSPPPPVWLDQALGWQPAPVGRQLCASVMWCGIEVALLEPTQHLDALQRARFSAGLWGDWLHGDGPKSLRGARDGDDYVLSVVEGEWLRVDAQMGANLRATPEQIGEYWLALLQDVQAIRMGRAPNQVKELERRRPLRLDLTPPRYPLLDRLYDRCRIQSREGSIDAEVILAALRSLGNPDLRRLREAARSIPLPKP